MLTFQIQNDYTQTSILDVQGFDTKGKVAVAIWGPFFNGGSLYWI